MPSAGSSLPLTGEHVSLDPSGDLSEPFSASLPPCPQGLAEWEPEPINKVRILKGDIDEGLAFVPFSIYREFKDAAPLGPEFLYSLIHSTLG